MSVATEILDALVTLIGTSSLTDYDVERQLIPTDYKTRVQRPKIVVAWNGKESKELDRVNEALIYKVAVGVHYPVVSVLDATEQNSVVGFVEDLQDFICRTDNRGLTLATMGTAKLQWPSTIDQIYDPQEVKQTGNFFSVMNFNYRYFKGRS